MWRERPQDNIRVLPPTRSMVRSRQTARVPQLESSVSTGLHTYMETSPLIVKGAKFRPMLDAQGLQAGRDLYRATPAVTQGIGFTCLIRRTTPFSCLLGHTRGCGRPILTEKIMAIKLFTTVHKMYLEMALHYECCHNTRNPSVTLLWVLKILLVQ
jgi:hypothetical protein